MTSKCGWLIPHGSGSAYQLGYCLYVCPDCKADVLLHLKNSVIMPTRYGTCNTFRDRRDTPSHNNAVGISGLVKISADSQNWKLSNTMRRAVLKKIDSLL